MTCLCVILKFFMPKSLRREIGMRRENRLKVSQVSIAPLSSPKMESPARTFHCIVIKVNRVCASLVFYFSIFISPFISFFLFFFFSFLSSTSACMIRKSCNHHDMPKGERERGIERRERMQRAAVSRGEKQHSTTLAFRVMILWLCECMKSTYCCYFRGHVPSPSCQPFNLHRIKPIFVCRTRAPALWQ